MHNTLGKVCLIKVKPEIKIGLNPSYIGLQRPAFQYLSIVPAWRRKEQMFAQTGSRKNRKTLNTYQKYMCGINGFVTLNPSLTNDKYQETQKASLKEMNDSIAHRGPDSEGIYIKHPVGFGFRRLSIVDLASRANQPMLSKDEQVVLIFNGEIYNYIELRKDLIKLGHTFNTESDTEVILNSYIEYGESCVEKFNGMWAFAIYDFNRQKFFCSRDRMGVKPFYYCIHNEALYFSSELKALHKACNLRKANHAKVYEYLAYGYRINDEETFFENCYELLPGTNLTYENNTFSKKKYWQLKENLYSFENGISYHDTYRKLFEDAVKLRHRSDVPVALLLSGGLDSSAIAKVTDNLIERGELQANTIQAYIASFPGDEFDETPVARELIQTCKHVKLNEVTIEPRKLINNLDNIIQSFDHPVFSFNCVVHNVIMKEINTNGIKVVLNGQGSDEAFAGYDRYVSGRFLIEELLSRNGKFFREFRYLNKHNKYRKSYLLSQMFKAVIGLRYSSYLRARYIEKTIPCLSQKFYKDNYHHYKPDFKFSITEKNFNPFLINQINQRGLNSILHYEDISSMSHSIEIRSPFLDYRIMEFAFSIPKNLKFKDGVTKVIQRETFGKMLPDSIVKNRQKIGFYTPFIKYISTDTYLKTYIQDILNSASFNSKTIWHPSKIREKFMTPSGSPDFPFWRILNLEVWSKKYNISNL